MKVIDFAAKLAKQDARRDRLLRRMHAMMERARRQLAEAGDPDRHAALAADVKTMEAWAARFRTNHEQHVQLGNDLERFSSLAGQAMTAITDRYDRLIGTIDPRAIDAEHRLKELQGHREAEIHKQLQALDLAEQRILVEARRLGAAARVDIAAWDVWQTSFLKRAREAGETCITEYCDRAAGGERGSP